jgi:hypothetical protein
VGSRLGSRRPEEVQLPERARFSSARSPLAIEAASLPHVAAKRPDCRVYPPKLPLHFEPRRPSRCKRQKVQLVEGLHEERREGKPSVCIKDPPQDRGCSPHLPPVLERSLFPKKQLADHATSGPSNQIFIAVMCSLRVKELSPLPNPALPKFGFHPSRIKVRLDAL